MSAKRKPKVDLLEAALDLVARKGWSGYSALELAAETGIGLAEACTQLGDRTAILDAMGRRADMAMIDLAPEELLELSRQERVFELLMRRFDGLKPARPALRALRGEAAPDAWLQGLGNLRRAIKLVVEAAGLPAQGPRAVLLGAALANAYLRTGRVWLDDDSEDQAATLAALDSNLGRMANFLRDPASDHAAAAG